MLTSTRENYLEEVFRLSHDTGDVRVTDLASALGCRLPTVTRTVRAMARDGWLVHDARKSVRLSRQGRQTAIQLAHRHLLATRLLECIGLSPDLARHHAGRLKHGLAPEVCDHLASWLKRLEESGSASQKPRAEPQPAAPLTFGLSRSAGTGTGLPG